MDTGSSLFENCVFVGNASTDRGGAVSSWGDVVFCGCTFWTNEAERGGAFYAMREVSLLIGCILWNGARLDAGQIAVASGGDVEVTYSAVQCGWPGEGNIGVDPIADDPAFVDGAGADGVPGTADDDLHLRASSPCIDSGGPDGPIGDIEGTTRPQGSGFDMGAYESAP